MVLLSILKIDIIFTITELPNKSLTRKLLEVMAVLIMWIVMIVTWVYVYVQTHQIVYINYTQLFYIPIIPL